MANGVHDGHRQRMRERIRKNGIASLEMHEILEYLLYSFIPRKDTNVIAHELLQKFGSLRMIMDSKPERLCEVSGMTWNASLFLTSLSGVFRKYLDEVNGQRRRLKDRSEAKKYMGSSFYGLRDEQICIVAVDVHDQILASDVLAVGTGDEVQLSVRAVVDFALMHKAHGVLLAHNHPGGIVTPSSQDVFLTRKLYDTLNEVGVKLLDHFIFCGENCYSFDEQRVLDKFRGNNNFNERHI